MPDPCPSARADLPALAAAADRAGRHIPPLWPLASSVAVNPFLGQTGESLASAGARFARVAGVAIAMPRRWYRDKISAGAISDRDLREAWARAPAHLRPEDIDALKAAAACEAPTPKALPTIADLAADVSGIDWPGLVVERFGAWAAGYFDEGQALWAPPRDRDAFEAWRAFATHDLTPEIAGLPGFARHVSEAPQSAVAAIARVVDHLGIGEAAMETYFHQMLMTLGGLPLISGLVGLVLWEIVVRLLEIPDYLLPPPSEVVVMLVERWRYLMTNLGYTALAAMAGFFVALVLGIVLGVAIASSQTIDRILYPWLVISRSIPKVVVAPLMLVWVGIGLKSGSIFAAALAA